MKALPCIWYVMSFQVVFAQVAFPGAEGFGAETVGGRGGRVIFVSNVEDSGEGSLRAACEAKGPRTVVFRTGGRIKLKSEISIEDPFLTIAGQTAPGDGICVSDRRVVIRTHDVIIRHMRFRPGDVSRSETDALTVNGGRRVLIDHCSFSWSTDEVLSVVGESDDVTVQWSIFSEALDRSFHSKGRHSFGSLIRPSVDSHISFHHNLYMSNMNRNPRVGSYEGRRLILEFVNNVVYNCAKAGIGGGRGEYATLDYSGNYVKKGPYTRKDMEDVVFSGDTEGMVLFQQGNLINGHDYGWRMFKGKYSRGEGVFPVKPVIGITKELAEQAMRRVALYAGATMPHRDAVDTRIVTQLAIGKGRIIDSQSQVGGWPDYKPGKPDSDSDDDGILDKWEKQMGLDPTDPLDGNTWVAGSNGYTYFDLFLIDMAGKR